MAFNGTGSNVTSLNANNISSGTVPTARLGSGTANSSTFLRGDQTYAAVAGAPNPLHGKQVFTSSGTFNVPTGVTTVLVTVIGAGGVGGNGSTCAGQGGGGGAGGYVVDYVAVTPGGTATVTVGVATATKTSSFAGTTTVTATGGSNGGNYSGDTGLVGLSAPASVFGQNYYTSGVVRYAGLVATQVSTRPIYLSGTFNDRFWEGQCYAHGYGAGGQRNSGFYTVELQQALGYGSGGGGGGSDGGRSAPTPAGNGLVVVEW